MPAIAVIPAKPPVEWFRDPALGRREPLHVERTGRIWGHAAGFGECHTGFPGECRQAPRSACGYAWFMRGEIECDDGSFVPCGHITMRTGHANVYEPAEEAIGHYDHTGFVAADVSAGEDAYGIWVAGAARPHLSEAELRELRGSDLSGDWRPGLGRDLELVGILCVNNPGFPAQRVLAASSHPHAALGLGMYSAGERVAALAAGALVDVIAAP